ncbi:hydrolase [Kluyvera genomosp. 2]|uniref:hydrolase n=1 Tax=Kluyvera genomosp. 2 TaxID=2774054 RepID=UPI002FD7C435
MTETTHHDLNIDTRSSATFVPMRGVSNRHLQTMLPRLIRRKLQFTPHWQRLELPDGDFVDLAWSEDPQAARHKPRLVVFHGLEGSLYSPYAHGLINAAKEQGWLCVVMHFRGCSGEPNRLNRIYHSGETEDGTWFLHWLAREYGHVPTAAVGYSLGGNMLACLLAKEGDNVPVDAAAIVSAPFMLEACSYHMDKGFSRVYQRYLLNLLKGNAARKLKAYPGSLPVDLRQLKSMRRIREFDDSITSKIHGFADAIDYYRQCSAMPILSKITKPTLIIHAKDDPFMDHHSIPAQEELPDNVEYQLTEHGGHVGFIGGTLRHPEMWLEKRIPAWLMRWLGTKG